MLPLYRPLFALVVAAALALPATAQSTQTFCSGTPVAFPASGTTSGPTGPYPTTITISDVTGTVTDVDIVVRGLSHMRPRDMDTFVEGPTGTTVWLFSDVGGDTSTPAADADVTLDDEAPGAQPIPFSGPLVTGTYIPVNVGTFDSFDPPAPAPPTSVSLADFDGQDPNGTWNLWGDDGAANNTGEFDEWCVVLTTEGGVTPIEDARELADGTPVTVRGVVTRAKGRFVYIQEADDDLGANGTPDAIVLFNFAADFFPSDLENGDVVEATGEIDIFNGLTEVSNISSFEVVGSAAVPTPQVVTAMEIIDNGEAYESELLTITGLMFENVTGTVFEANSNYDLAGTDLVLRVGRDTDSELVGEPIPMGTFTYTGVLGQFDNATPGTDDGFQLIPVDSGDVEAEAVATPEIDVTPTSVAFGMVDVGTTDQATVIITNNGDGDLTISDISLAGDAAFSIASGGGAGILAPGTTREVVVEFAPTAATASTGTLTITSDDADEGTVTVALSGQGRATGGGTCAYAFEAGPKSSLSVPSAGGRVEFVYSLDNTGSAMAEAVDIWARVVNENGTTIFVRGPRPVQVPGGSVFRAGYNQRIPASVADGTYEYTILAGTYDDLDPAASEVCGSETFTVTKGEDLRAQAGSGASAKVLSASDWPTGEIVDVEITEAALTMAGDEVRVGPNPTRGTATFAFALADDAEVTLAVYDVQGRTVATVVEGVLRAGTHTASLREALAPGVYVWQLRAGSRVETGRLTVVR